MLLCVIIFLRSIHKLEDIRNISLTFCSSFFSPLDIEVEIKLGYYMDAIQNNQHFPIWVAILGSQICTETLGALSEGLLRSYMYS